jgi:arabinoxylan arabinofuranohydrolase
VDFTVTGAARFIASVAGATDGGAIELRLDDPSGALIGTLKVKPTGDLNKWETQSCDVSSAKGVHDLVLKFTGSDGMQLNFDWWKFESTGTN